MALPELALPEMALPELALPELALRGTCQFITVCTKFRHLPLS